MDRVFVVWQKIFRTPKAIVIVLAPAQAVHGRFFYYDDTLRPEKMMGLS